MNRFFGPCAVKCCVCGNDMDWMTRYGRVASCCSKECYDEFEWRQTLAIMKKPYKPRPQKKENDGGTK
jgi:hypothetical protein